MQDWNIQLLNGTQFIIYLQVQIIHFAVNRSAVAIYVQVQIQIVRVTNFLWKK